MVRGLSLSHALSLSLSARDLETSDQKTKTERLGNLSITPVQGRNQTFVNSGVKIIEKKLMNMKKINS